MEFEIDHVFICTDMDAPQAGLFIGFGLNEGPANYHNGQGTANRRFFFDNAMIELMWVDDPIEAQDKITSPTRLWDRWLRRDLHLSPFGICLRPSFPDSGEIPFDGWEYKPEYLPEEHFFWIGNNSNQLLEPMVIYSPLVQRPDLDKEAKHVEHKNGFREITSITVSSPSFKKLSPTLEAISKVDGITIKEDEKHTMNIGFDGEKMGHLIDFQPHLPLSFSW